MNQFWSNFARCIKLQNNVLITDNIITNTKIFSGRNCEPHDVRYKLLIKCCYEQRVVQLFEKYLVFFNKNILRHYSKHSRIVKEIIPNFVLLAVGSGTF